MHPYFRDLKNVPQEKVSQHNQKLLIYFLRVNISIRKIHTCHKHINKHAGSFDVHREDPHNKAARELSAEKPSAQGK